MSAILLVAISFFAIIPTSVPSANNPIAQALITTGVSPSARPLTENLTVVDHEIGTVTFYTEIVGLQGRTVVHQWLYNEQEVASISLHLQSQRSLNWTQSTIGPQQIGHWEVRVVDTHGNVLAARHFDVIESGRSVQQIVAEKQVDVCQIRLAELAEQIKQNPDVEYFKFLYDKQLKRCK